MFGATAISACRFIRVSPISFLIIPQSIDMPGKARLAFFVQSFIPSTHNFHYGQKKFGFHLRSQ